MAGNSLEKKEVLRVQVQLKDNKYPYFNSENLDLTGIGDRQRGRIIYVSGRFVRSEGDEKFIEFERINTIAVKLNDAKVIKTEKDTVVLKYQQNSVVYLVEIPSGYRGDIETNILVGECIKTVILQSPRGSIGVVEHIWCNTDAEIQYRISGRTRTVGYTHLTDLFGENLSGKIMIKDGKVEMVYDEQLDQLLG